MVEVDSGVATFRFRRPQASGVWIAGDFNDWRTDALPMQSVGDGWWTARLPLKPGAYRFRYYADGQWYVDYLAFGIRYGAFGPDGVLYVPAAGPACPRCGVPA